MASSPIALAATAARIQTVADIRAAMGAVTTTLAQGYSQLANIHASGGIIHDFTPLGWLMDRSVDDIYTAAKSLLDTVNQSATILYNIYTDDPDLQDEDISAAHATSAGLVIAEANDALKAVEDAAAQKWWDIAQIVSDALDAVQAEAVAAGQAAGSTLESLTNAAVSGVTAFAWSARWTLALVGAAGLAYVFRRRLFGAFTKAVGA